MLVVLAIPIGMIAVAVRLSMGHGVLFRQRRLGQHAKSFDIVKFRTMRNVYDATGHMLADEERITKFGHFLRASSLDELPELWNILRGEMSFVGPRPLLPEYLPYYLEQQARRHEVRPGLTGLAQVSGRNAQTWDERFELDLRYVDNLSFWRDVSILCLTVRSVLLRDGINAEGHATMPRFDEQVVSGLAKGNLPPSNK